MLRAGRSSPVPPACSIVPGLQLSACERPAAFSMLKTRAASSGTRDASGLVQGSRQGAPSQPCPGVRRLAVMCPHHPTTGWGCTSRTPRLPIPSATSIPLLQMRCPGPWHGTALPAGVTVSPNPGSELTYAFLLFGFSLARKNLDPGSLSAKQTESLRLPRREQQQIYALHFAASLQGQFGGKQSAGAHRQGEISRDGWQKIRHVDRMCASVQGWLHWCTAKCQGLKRIGLSHWPHAWYILGVMLSPHHCPTRTLTVSCPAAKVTFPGQGMLEHALAEGWEMGQLMCTTYPKMLFWTLPTTNSVFSYSIPVHDKPSPTVL